MSSPLQQANWSSGQKRHDRDRILHQGKGLAARCKPQGSTMIELLIEACLLSGSLSAPEGECRDFSLLFDPRDVSVMTCMLQAQPIIAQWKESHHKWDVRRWQCGMRSMDVSSI